MKKKYILAFILVIFSSLTLVSANNTTRDINNNSYSDFFDNNGNIKNSTIADGDVLDISGEIKNKQFNINKPLNITSSKKDARLLNCTINIYSTAAGTNITNLIINVNNSEGTGIALYKTHNIKISNNIININTEYDAYGIYMLESNNIQVTANNITAHGEDLTFGILGYMVNNSSITNNNMWIIARSALHAYDTSIIIKGDMVVPEVFKTYGIIMLYSSNNDIGYNYINASSRITQQNIDINRYTNSIVGIDLYYNSHYNNVHHNQVYVTANDPFLYGMGVLGGETNVGSSTAMYNNFPNNKIRVNGTYYANGIIVGHNSLYTHIANNDIICNAINNTYGVILELSSGSSVEDNVIKGSAQVVYSVELFGSNNNYVKGNIIEGEGDLVRGVAFYSSSNNSIINNTINNYGKDTADSGSIAIPDHADLIPPGNAPIDEMAGSNNNYFSGNVINTVKGVNSPNNGGSGQNGGNSNGGGYTNQNSNQNSNSQTGGSSTGKNNPTGSISADVATQVSNSTSSNSNPSSGDEDESVSPGDSSDASPTSSSNSLSAYEINEKNEASTNAVGGGEYLDILAILCIIILGGAEYLRKRSIGYDK